jgi:tetratricopeptide (TPR) repeat protein
MGGHFLVHSVVAGGMGEVYLCTEVASGSPYALKTFQTRFLGSPNARAAFKREAGIWISLGKHPNIVRCFFVEEIDDRPFIALEWVAGDERRGTDLGSWLRHGPLTPRLALEFAIDICRGLAYAARTQPGIVHRDLKPANVLVSSARMAKITDFGLAQSQWPERDTDQVSSGVGRYRLSANHWNVAGSAGYMAPEHWLDETLDARADLYAFGCVLYELLTGRHLFEANTRDELRHHHFHAAVPELPARDRLSLDVNQVLAGCLAKRRQDRFGAADELLETLATIYRKHFGDAPTPEAEAVGLEASDHLERGSAYCQLTRFDDALNELTCAIQLGVKPLYRAYHDRGVANYGLGRLDQAISDFTLAIQHNAAAATSFTCRGGAYERLGHHEAALIDHTHAIRLDPKLALAYSNRGAALKNLGRSEEALADLAEAIRLDPSGWRAYERRGNILDLLGRLDGALADYSSAIRLEPARAESYRARGSILQRLGRADEALADFHRALEWDASCLLALVGIGTVLANRGQLAEALKHFEAAASRGESLGAGHAARARRELGLEPYSEADTFTFAYAAFRRADSLDELLRAIQVFPFLLVPRARTALEQRMAQDNSPDERGLAQRLSWLRQIASAQAVREQGDR